MSGVVSEKKNMVAGEGNEGRGWKEKDIEGEL